MRSFDRNTENRAVAISRPYCWRRVKLQLRIPSSKSEINIRRTMSIRNVHRIIPLLVQGLNEPIAKPVYFSVRERSYGGMTYGKVMNIIHPTSNKSRLSRNSCSWIMNPYTVLLILHRQRMRILSFRISIPCQVAPPIISRHFTGKI
ncbi:hypothetical protein D3C77_399130 [compost metagenome]